MDTFNELTQASQRRYNGLRRKLQFFSTFAGGVIEALRELGYRLSDFDKQAPYPVFGQVVPRQTGEGNMELFFEQQDQDQCRVLIIPFRTDLGYLSKNRYTAQLGLELSRYTSDPDVLREALNANYNKLKGQFLGGLGGKTVHKLDLDSPPDLRQPGSMAFELQGARLVVALNVVVDLAKYRQGDFGLDIPLIKADFEAYFYGLEKYLALLLRTFGSDVVVEEPAGSIPS